MRTGRRLLTAAAAACFLAGDTASAITTFHTAQQAAIASLEWNDVVLYNYTTTGISALGPAFGDRTAGYAAPAEQWVGIFLYDYGFGAYTAAQYSLVDELFQRA